ncbi:protoporphyrinogen oxidase [Acidimicrobium ferrooxidans DSM 10331]|uniref:Protoporphyrinogen oxidase n=1 Tax=Acidimicrobium ferrooxidans (strain DSM 10331 / JCM 15462 / NBRC 103882 / ICP) TaxID=525909 RepID=C7M197_ACIFD|nr:FAD-dependent oxidoreductase [Acidimicrobium ferrooxidans]ACU54745.1 protoporphyrinogen oxidase [Acidimicrobium ferrooxidans DSM 10331]
MNVIVVGGGISGLAAAWEAARHGASVMLLESSDRLGGKLLTSHVGGSLVELGPDSLLTRTPSALELVDSLGLDLVAPTASRALLWSRGARRPIPPGLVLGAPPNLERALSSDLVGPITRLRAAWGVIARSRRGHETDDLGRLAAWRWGRTWSERHIEPLVGGINANTIVGLSARVSAPSILSMPPSGPPAPAPSRPTRPAFVAPSGGLSTLVDAVAQVLVDLGVDVRSSTSVTELAPAPHGTAVTTSDGSSFSADAVVLAVPAFRAAEILAASAPEASLLLRGIRYASVSVLALSIAPTLAPSLKGVAGVLVDRREGLMTTAVSLASEKWPHWAGDDALLRVSAGNLHDVRPLDRDDDRLRDDLVAEAEGILEATLEIRDARLARWTNAFPHFAPWHLDLVERIDRELRDALGSTVALAGAWRRGSGIPTCIASGRDAARATISRDN